MKKRVITVVCICILIVAGLIVYFRPMSLDGRISEDNAIIVTADKFEVKDGNPDIDFKKYPDLNEAQKKEIVTVLSQFTYRRTLKTIFSDGSISDPGSQIIYIFVWNNDSIAETICVSDNGKFAVGNKTYEVKNADALVGRILSIVE